MTVDPQLLSALRRTAESLGATDPAAAGVRVHLARLLLADGQAAPALEQAAAALGVTPFDPGALCVAATAAEALGRRELAEGYRRLHGDLLSRREIPPAAAAPPEPSAPPAPDPSLDGPIGWDSEDPRRVRLSDVAGMTDVKRRLRSSLLAPLAHPQLRKVFAKQLRGGLLLWGPPGTGKTLIARALAGELGAGFLSATPADVYGSYFGESERNIARLFTRARQEAPAVVFLDELDALGGRRSRRTNDQSRSVVNQLLIELDGQSDNGSVFVLAATNAPWDVDDALRRPGRFDRSVLVLPPDADAREWLLRQELAGRPTTANLDVAGVVRRTATYSGADLVRLVDSATERALDRSVDAGVVSAITTDDLRAALADTPPSTHAWLGTASTYLAYGGDGPDVADLRAYLRANRVG